MSRRPIFCNSIKAKGNWNEKRILVLDGDLFVGKSIQEVMESEHIDVQCALSGSEAINLLNQNDYCIVRLGGFLGTEESTRVIQYIRKSKTIPIMALTENLEVSDKTVLFHAGISVCTEKPFGVEICSVQAHSLMRLYLRSIDGELNGAPLGFWQ